MDKEHFPLRKQIQLNCCVDFICRSDVAFLNIQDIEKNS